MEDYDTEAAFLKDRVTDIIVSSKHRDSMLTAEGKPTRVWQGVAGGHRVHRVSLLPCIGTDTF